MAADGFHHVVGPPPRLKLWYHHKININTHKNCPMALWRIVQISDVHPAPAHHGSTRIPELREKIAACRPDLLVLTGDIFDEFTEPKELEAFCSMFGEIDAPLGKYYVLGNHDLFTIGGSQASAVRTWSRLGQSGRNPAGRYRRYAALRPCASWAARGLFVYEWPAFYCRPVDSRRAGTTVSLTGWTTSRGTLRMPQMPVRI